MLLPRTCLCSSPTLVPSPNVSQVAFNLSLLASVDLREALAQTADVEIVLTSSALGSSPSIRGRSGR